MSSGNTSIREKTLSALLMFIIGFAGVSVLGAIALVIMITLGIIPSL